MDLVITLLTCARNQNKDKHEFKLGNQIPLLEKAYPFCDNFDCMPCKMNVIASLFNMKSKFVEGCISKKGKSRAASPLKAKKTSLSPKSSDKSHKTSKGATIANKHTNALKTPSSHTIASLYAAAKNHGPKLLV